MPGQREPREFMKMIIIPGAVGTLIGSVAGIIVGGDLGFMVGALGGLIVGSIVGIVADELGLLGKRIE